MPDRQSKPFLKAEWRKLIMANYVVDPSLLLPYLPPKTEIDTWNQRCYISLVGFMFLNTTVKGVKIPFHTNFEEVNLRFYVRHQDGESWKRGVVFLKEIVPKPAVAFVANTFFKENYVTMPMANSLIATPGALNIEYRWRGKHWNLLGVASEKAPKQIEAGSEEEFITEHYWGYAKAGQTHSREYQVEHPRWQIYPVRSSRIEVDFDDVYGSSFGFLSKEKPVSVFLAEGSEIVVRDSRKI